MRPGDRLVCAFIKSLPVHEQFKQWPLHVTIVPWFRLDLSVAELAAGLKGAFVGSHPFEVTVSMEARFGYKQRKQVNLVKAEELQRLEGQTRRFLHAYKAWVVDEADKTRRGFRPHVTVQQNDRVQRGDTFWCEKLSVVRQCGDYKEVESIISL